MTKEWRAIKNISALLFILFFSFSQMASAHHPRFVKSDIMRVSDPEISQAFYATMNGRPQTYEIQSEQPFELYVQLLVPDLPGMKKNLSATISRDGEQIARLNGLAVEWDLYYEEFGGDSYYMGPEFAQVVPGGKYTVTVSRPGNTGKYVFVVGRKEIFTGGDIWRDTLNMPNVKGFFEKPRYTAYFNTSGRLLLLGITTPVMAYNVEDLPPGRKDFMIATLLNQLGAVLPGVVDHAPASFSTPDTHLVKSWQISRDTIVLDNIFSTNNAGVLSHLKSRGGGTGLSLRLSRTTQAGLQRMDYRVDAYSANSLARTMHARAHLLSLKSVHPVSDRFTLGLQYRYLDNASIPAVHFANVFAGTHAGDLKGTIGLTFQSTSGTRDKVRVFGNLAYPVSDDLELFAEYTGADFLKSVQKHMIAAAADSAVSINTHDTPDSALSVGATYKLENGSFLKLGLYDIDHSTKSFVQYSLVR